MPSELRRGLLCEGELNRYLQRSTGARFSSCSLGFSGAAACTEPKRASVFSNQKNLFSFRVRRYRKKGQPSMEVMTPIGIIS